MSLRKHVTYVRRKARMECAFEFPRIAAFVTFLFGSTIVERFLEWTNTSINVCFVTMIKQTILSWIARQASHVAIHSSRKWWNECMNLFSSIEREYVDISLISPSRKSMTRQTMRNEMYTCTFYTDKNSIERSVERTTWSQEVSLWVI
jgi:hypothetical protein